MMSTLKSLTKSRTKTHRLAGNQVVALQYYAWALRVRRAVFGYKAVVVADTLYNMALLMKRIGKCASLSAHVCVSNG